MSCHCSTAVVSCAVPGIQRCLLEPVKCHGAERFTPIVSTQYFFGMGIGRVETGIVSVVAPESPINCKPTDFCGNPNSVPNTISCPFEWAQCGRYCMTYSLGPSRFRATQQVIRVDAPENPNESLVTSSDYPPLSIPVTLDVKLRMEDIPLTDRINAIQITTQNLNADDMDLSASVESSFISFDLDATPGEDLTFHLTPNPDRLQPIEVNMEMTLRNNNTASVLAISYGHLD